MPDPRVAPPSPFRTRPRAAGTPAYEIRAATSVEAEILLYEEIGCLGVDARAFCADLRRITASTIHLRINSPGGNVFDAVAIANGLKAHPARVVTHIDSVAASAASLVAIAGDEVRIASNAFFMIHEPFALTMGTADDLRAVAGTLDKVSTNFVEAYMERSGADAPTVRAWMQDETWFTADEAVAAGFADSVAETTKVAARFDLSIYANAPTALRQPAEEPRERRADHIAAGVAPTTRDIERILRDAGLSKQQARAVAASGHPALARWDAAAEPDSVPAAVVERLIAAFQLA